MTRLEAADSPADLTSALARFVRAPSPAILGIALAVSLSLRLAVGDYGLYDLAIVGAILLAWPLLEWLIHVYILHLRPFRIAGHLIDMPVPKSHRAHHRDPWRIEILFIPLHSYIYTAPLLVLLWLGLAPSISLGLTGLATTYALSLHYEWVHFLVHTRYKPRSSYYQRLWRNHRLHHCKNEAFWMGVTMLAGDHVFGTAKAPHEVPSSATCRTLGFEETLGAP